MTQVRHDWTTGLQAWAEFVKRHPELGYRPGRWSFHNFLRYYRQSLIERDAIRRAKRRFWVAHRIRFQQACFDLATGAATAQAVDGCEGGVA